MLINLHVHAYTCMHYMYMYSVCMHFEGKKYKTYKLQKCTCTVHVLTSTVCTSSRNHTCTCKCFSVQSPLFVMRIACTLDIYVQLTT